MKLRKAKYVKLPALQLGSPYSYEDHEAASLRVFLGKEDTGLRKSFSLSVLLSPFFLLHLVLRSLCSFVIVVRAEFSLVFLPCLSSTLLGEREDSGLPVTSLILHANIPPFKSSQERIDKQKKVQRQSQREKEEVNTSVSSSSFSGSRWWKESTSEEASGWLYLS